ncbi:hypothetical protein ATN84_15330 [Paramesorhizobium deserti]|uniref:DUF1127 domain-containing protein n=1 Tax=Paramesorhizobium deserti TaxID=1494590 RepID=A0A135HST9_9HYPH|nr:hypothetical protein [Paramesorhizobium deserti]KXF76261.1 hypothetical protein ATN84_15330 [Paramesorhizobium deserti]
MGIVIPPILSVLQHYRRKMQERRAQIRTERMINDLPRYIQKDIGWPDARTNRNADWWKAVL